MQPSYATKFQFNANNPDLFIYIYNLNNWIGDREIAGVCINKYK